MFSCLNLQRNWIIEMSQQNLFIVEIEGTNKVYILAIFLHLSISWNISTSVHMLLCSPRGFMIELQKCQKSLNWKKYCHKCSFRWTHFTHWHWSYDILFFTSWRYLWNWSISFNRRITRKEISTIHRWVFEIWISSFRNRIVFFGLWSEFRILF